jgi:uncharacterized protein
VEISGVYIIPAAKQAVWEALIDPTLLEACIPGCEAVQQVAAHKYTGKITGKVGPIKAGFTGDLILTNLNPPDSYTRNGNGHGGLAGLARAWADVAIETIDAENTRLAYTARTELEGLLAKIAARLVTGTAIKYLDQFFDRFSEQVVARRDAVARID